MAVSINALLIRCLYLYLLNQQTILLSLWTSIRSNSLCYWKLWDLIFSLLTIHLQWIRGRIYWITQRTSLESIFPLNVLVNNTPCVILLLRVWVRIVWYTLLIDSLDKRALLTVSIMHVLLVRDYWIGLCFLSHQCEGQTFL